MVSSATICEATRRCSSAAKSASVISDRCPIKILAWAVIDLHRRLADLQPVVERTKIRALSNLCHSKIGARHVGRPDDRNRLNAVATILLLRLSLRGNDLDDSNFPYERSSTPSRCATVDRRKAGSNADEHNRLKRVDCRRSGQIRQMGHRHHHLVRPAGASRRGPCAP